MKLNIVEKVRMDWKGWKTDKMPGLAPGGFFPDQDIEIDQANKRFNQIMDIIYLSEINLHCTSSFALAKDLTELYFDMTGEKLFNVNYQDDKYTVQIKIRLNIPEKLENEFVNLMKCQSLPFNVMFFKDSTLRWVASGEGVTEFAFYLIALHEVRL